MNLLAYDETVIANRPKAVREGNMSLELQECFDGASPCEPGESLIDYQNCQNGPGLKPSVKNIVLTKGLSSEKGGHVPGRIGSGQDGLCYIV